MKESRLQDFLAKPKVCNYGLPRKFCKFSRNDNVNYDSASCNIIDCHSLLRGFAMTMPTDCAMRFATARNDSLPFCHCGEA